MLSVGGRKAAKGGGGKERQSPQTEEVDEYKGQQNEKLIKLLVFAGRKKKPGKGSKRTVSARGSDEGKKLKTTRTTNDLREGGGE